MNEGFAFTAEFDVRVGDINYGGHMGKDKFLLLFHDARMLYLESLGCSEADIGGVGLIMNEAHVNYKAEVFLRDRLRVGVRAAEIGGTRFRLEYRVERAADGALAATGYTGMVAFDYANRRVAKIPEKFRAAIEP